MGVTSLHVCLLFALLVANGVHKSLGQCMSGILFPHDPDPSCTESSRNWLTSPGASVCRAYKGQADITLQPSNQNEFFEVRELCFESANVKFGRFRSKNIAGKMEPTQRARPKSSKNEICMKPKPARLKSLTINFRKIEADADSSIHNLRYTVCKVSADISDTPKIGKLETADVSILQLQDDLAKVQAKLAEYESIIDKIRAAEESSDFYGFSASLDVEQTFSSNEVVRYSKEEFNSAAYNKATGKFTCPMDGYYIFYASVFAEEGKVQMIHKEKVITAASASGYSQSSTQAMILCMAQEEVYLRAVRPQPHGSKIVMPEPAKGESVTLKAPYNGGYRNSFSGYRIKGYLDRVG